MSHRRRFETEFSGRLLRNKPKEISFGEKLWEHDKSKLSKHSAYIVTRHVFQSPWPFVWTKEIEIELHLGCDESRKRIEQIFFCLIILYSK